VPNPAAYPFIVTAGQIVLNAATYIADGTIGNAMIGNYIQDDAYEYTPNVSHSGWKIDKSGSISASAITVYQSDGTVILDASGISNDMPLGGSTAGVLTTSVANFELRNDRDATAIVVPTIATNGDAVDHVNNTDGSCDISFEWLWAGTEIDIDGFEVFIYSATTGANYTFGTATAAESVFNITGDRRAFVLSGVPADRYYTFGVRAYRVVDPDVNAAGVIKTTIVQPSIAAEDGYQPETAVAFAGNITGTINGNSISAHLNTNTTALNVGLGNVNNTSDATQQAATLSAATANDVGLGSVNNTSDATQQAATLAAATASDVGLGSVTDGANVNAPGLGAKANMSSFTVADQGEFYVHGFDGAGNAADVDGYISLASTPTGIAKGSVLTAGLGGGWVMYCHSANFFPHGGTQTRIAMVKNDGGQWYWNNNSIWSAFTPSGDSWVIGTCFAGATDAAGIYRITLWAAGTHYSQIGAFADLDQITSSNADVYIGDLAVDTLQIAGNAITIPDSDSYTTPSINGTAAWTADLCEVSIEVATAAEILIFWAFRLGWSGGSSWGLRVYDVSAASYVLTRTGMDATVDFPSGVIARTAGSAGTYTFQLQFYGADADVTMQTATLVAQGAMK